MTPGKSDQMPNNQFRRIVLTLSLTGEGGEMHAIEHTVNFAGVFNSDVACLCVRDSELLNYAALPFAREFSSQNATARAMDPNELRKEMDRRAASIQQILEKLLVAQKRQHTFVIVDGRMEDKVAELAEEDDLLVMTLSNQALRSFRTSYEKIEQLGSHRRCHILLLRERQQFPTPMGNIAILVHDTPPSDRTINLALHIARKHHVNVDIFVTEDKKLSVDVEKRCAAILSEQETGAPYLSLKSLDQCLMHHWRRPACSLVIIERNDNLPPQNILDQSLDIFRAPMLLYRC